MDEWQLFNLSMSWIWVHGKEFAPEIIRVPAEGRENGIYWKDQKDDMDGVTIPTPYVQQFLHP